MQTHRRKALAALTLTLALVGCGGGAAGGGSTTTGIALPSEISALPATGAGPASLRALRALPGGDYAAAETTKAVSEPALSQFDILNTIFGAIAQTHYADAGNVDGGPYAAVVSWLDNGDDRAQKRLVRWVVNSRMVTVDGRAVNRVQVWFFDVQDGQPRVIRVGLDVAEAPTRNADGSYSDYGVWTLDAKLAADASQYFVAAADRVTVSGQAMSRVMINQADRNGARTRGVLLRAAGQGYGKVRYPDWNRCDGPDCTPPEIEVAYVYDGSNVALRRGDATQFKSRTASVDVVTRYGLYDGSTGADVTRTFAFGFPIRFTQGGVQQYGYYGAWQGRHQLWAGGGSVAAGLTVYRGDSDSSATAYVTSPVFEGVLTKRTYAPSSLGELTDVVLGTWLGQGAQASFDGSDWTACINPQWSGQSQSCSSQQQVSDPAAFFGAQPPEQINLNVWTQQSGSQNLVHQGGKFWVAVPGQDGQWSPTATEWIPQAGAQVWVWRNGPAWLVHDGAGWWKKGVVAYDPQTHTPTFGGGDTAYTFPQDQDLNLNDQGVNYVVRLSGGAYSVRIERQQVPTPADAAAMIPSDLRFARGCCGDTSSTFQFVTAPGDHYLQLVYATVGPQDQAAGRQAGDVVAEGIWNLTAQVGGVPTGEAFSWDYPAGGNGYAVQQYLLLGGAYQVLHDPLRFSPISLTSWAGKTRSCALQFDGSWLGGVPDVQQLLRSNGGDMTADIAAQVINVSEGQQVADALDARPYVFKPLSIAQFLLPVADPGDLDLAPALALDLSTVPAFVDPALGDPPGVPVRYSEGSPVP